jgi:hypothetical protein
MQGYAPLTTSVGLFAVVYDEEEEPINDWTATCQCVGLKPGSATSFSPVIRLKDVNPAYTTNSTYTEIQGGGPPGPTTQQRFMHHFGIEVHVGGGAADLEWWGRGHFSRADFIFAPALAPALAQ